MRAALAAAPATTTWSSSTTRRARWSRPSSSQACLRALADADAAIAAAPVTDTVKEATAGASPRTLDRSRAVGGPDAAGLPPRRARARARPGPTRWSAAATDDASLVEALGGTVRVVAAPRENLKVTTALDLRVAEMLLRAAE